MGETPEQKFDQISRAVQESILRNYPNPERRGCPGDEVVRSVAARGELNADAAWEHITHCSPCYSEFLAFKDQLRGERRREVRMRRRTLLGVAAALVVGVPVVVVSRRDQTAEDVVIAEWDLERYAPSRTVDAEPERPPFRAPLKRGRILARLPRGTDEGSYEIEIRRTEEGGPLRKATGTAHIINGHTELPFELDLSDLPAGCYFAAIGGRGKSWRVQPLLLQ